MAIQTLTDTIQTHDPESLLWEIARLRAENAELRRQLQIASQA